MYISRVRHVRSWVRCFPQRFVILPRLTALLTSLVLASSGCRQSAPSGSETTITLIDWIDKQYQDPDNQEISEFTRETGIRVKVLPRPRDRWSNWLPGRAYLEAKRASRMFMPWT